MILDVFLMMQTDITCTVEPAMISQPLMGGHLAILQNGISYTNESPMSSHLPSYM